MASEPVQVTYTVPDDVLVQELSNGDVVLLNLATEAYFGLDEIGARLFAKLSDGGTIADAHGDLLGEYEVEAEELNRDLEALVSRLLEYGLLEPND